MNAGVAPPQRPAGKKPKLRRDVSAWPGITEAMLFVVAFVFSVANKNISSMGLLIFGIEVKMAVIALAAVVPTAVIGWIIAMRDLRNFREMTPTKIGSATPGYVEFVGHCLPVPGEPLRSKFLGEPCVWCGYRDEDRAARVIRQIGAIDAPFILYDRTGSCRVEPGDAVVEAWHTDTWDAGGHRYTEWKLFEGSEVLVLGEYTLRGNAAPRFAASAEPEMPERLRAANPGDFAATLESVRRDYQQAKVPEALTKTLAWSRKVIARIDSVARARLEARDWSSRRDVFAGTHREDGVLAKPADGRPFLITMNNRQAELSRKKFSRNSQVVVAVIALIWIGWKLAWN